MRSAALAALLAGSASAQDTVFTVEFDVTTNTGEIRAGFFGDLPAGTTAIGTVWSTTSFRLTGDGPLDILGYNPAYDFFGTPDIAGRGSDSLRFTGSQAPATFGSFDPSNPLRVASFSYGGSPNQLDMELFGQNWAMFVGVPSEPFGTIVPYLTIDPPPGATPLTWRIDIVTIPSPATLALAPIALVAARRRRK